MPDLSVLVSPGILMVAAAIVAVLATLGRVTVRGRKRLSDVANWRRVLPILPLLLGIVFVMIPGAYPGEDGGAVPVGSRILAGLWAGFLASHARKLFTRSVLGRLDHKAAPKGAPE